MNKTKIQKIIEEVMQRKASKEASAERKARINDQIQQLKKEREEAAVRADRESMRSIRNQIADLEDDLYILDKQNEAIFISKEEGQKVWREFESDYEKQLDSLVSAYKKQASVLYDKFMAIVDLQNEALESREKVAAACGINGISPNNIGNHDPLPDFPMKFFDEKSDDRFSGYRIWQPCAKYFLLAGICKDSEREADLYNNVLRLRNSYKG